MHYYLFNIGDYQSHTAHLDENEDLAYRRMLDWCYLHEKPLPTEIPDVARLIRMRTHSESIANVLREFFKLTESGWWSDRVGREIAAVQMKSEKAKASAHARWNANALQSDCDRYAIQDPRPKTQDTIPKIQDPRPKKTQATVVAAPDGVSTDTWEAFVTLRRAKKAPVTKRALDGIMAEAQKAGWSLDAAMTEMAARGWAGFKAEWVALKEGPKSAQERNKTILEGLTRGLIGGGHAKFIE